MDMVYDVLTSHLFGADCEEVQLRCYHVINTQRDEPQIQQILADSFSEFL
jgi:hypothetical protein